MVRMILRALNFTSDKKKPAQKTKKFERIELERKNRTEPKKKSRTAMLIAGNQKRGSINATR
ncbi:MAG: hypothetical protein FWE47_02630 [Oscillospiraceae bacterium]|nr:hypothetical protein [Oscillospiraceae bacterium]